MRSKSTRLPRLDPAKSIIDACGGTKVVSDVTGADRTYVWRWTQPKENGGTGGLIPAEYQPVILEWARMNSKQVTPEMFFCQVAPHTEAAA